jgi:protein ImuB
VLSSVSSSQRILCLWFNRLSTDRLMQQSHENSWLAQRAPRREEAPLVVFGRGGNLDLVVALNDAAEHIGLAPGLALAQARAMHPALVCVAEDQAADARLLEHIADWCQRYTPLVACRSPDTILLDITGCTHLFGGEEKLSQDVTSRMQSFGFAARAAIASSIGAAWATAHFATAGIMPRGEERGLLPSLPVAALRLPEETIAALDRVGLKCVGDLLDLPRAPLAARFGTDLLRQVDRALGDEAEPLSPRLPVPVYMAEKSFFEPIAREQDVLASIEHLAGRLSAKLATHGDGARQVELALFRTDGVVKRVRVGTARPQRNAQTMRALFAERLAVLGEEIDPGFGFDLARLSVLVAEPCMEEQIGFATHDEQRDLDRLIDRLSARLGTRRITRLACRESHIPELATMALPAQTARAVSHHWDNFRDFRAETGLSARPLRLLPKPESIFEVIALVPDGPPLRFRWRRAWHEIVAVEGPERIEGAWWNEDGGGLIRDYFQVEDKAGLRFWVFRAGHYRGSASEHVMPDMPRWFMHGMYG